MAREMDPKLLTQVKNAYVNYVKLETKGNFGKLRGSNPAKYREVLTLIKGLLEEIDLLLKNRDLLEEKILNIPSETKRKYFISLLNGLKDFKDNLLEGKNLLESSA